jgi:hypothetical protein
MKLNLGYPWLCLCLFFSLLTMSCAVKHTGAIQVSPAVNSNDVYQLQVKIMVHGPEDDVPGEFTPYLVQPYNVKYWDSTMVFLPKTLILYFRFPYLKQLQLCRDQLLSTGQVEQVIVTKY